MYCLSLNRMQFTLRKPTARLPREPASERCMCNFRRQSLTVFAKAERSPKAQPQQSGEHPGALTHAISHQHQIQVCSSFCTCCNAGHQNATGLTCLSNPAHYLRLQTRVLPAGIGLKAVWIGAEKFGDLVGLTQAKPPDTSKRSAASSQATVSQLLLCALHASLFLHNSWAVCSSQGGRPLQK